MIDFDNLTLEAAYHSLFLSASSCGRPYAMWRLSPVRSGMRNALGMIARQAARALVLPVEAGGPLARVHRIHARAAPSIARPEHVPISDPAPIARWLADRAAANAPALLNTREQRGSDHRRRAAGLDLDGLFRVGGEPLTDAKAAAVEDSGSRAIPTTRWASRPGGLPCARATARRRPSVPWQLALIQRNHRSRTAASSRRSS